MAHRASTKAGRPASRTCKRRRGEADERRPLIFTGSCCAPSSGGRADGDWQLRPEFTLPHGYFLSKPQTPNYLSPSHLISVSQCKCIHRARTRAVVQITTTFRESCIPAAQFVAFYRISDPSCATRIFYEGGSERSRKMVLVQSIGKYRVGRTIGEGSFAKVKLAVDTETGGSVAVKVIDRSTVLRNNLMYQVKREISAMKLLNHPNIVKIHEVIATKTKICLVMEYVPGGQLSDRLSYHKRLDEREANKYFYQLIDAVDYCHRRGVFHRDLKPENLLLDNQGNLKVSDFGLSVLRKPGQLLSTSCGSPCYVAPEVFIRS
ncbi:hypothetical protein ACQ4PT_066282 [Festuca glaucescens]